jgi:predicted RNase H-like nuclease (RuvC/YqgF family)
MLGLHLGRGNSGQEIPMRAGTRSILVSGFVLSIGLLPLAFSQDAEPAPEPEPTLAQRVQTLERSLIQLNSQLQLRTDVSGPEDRRTRDFNLEQQINDLERQIQQLNNTVMDLQRQLSDALRAANQAQSDAMQAQQIARDAQSRIN